MRIAVIYPQYHKVDPVVRQTYGEPLGAEYIAAKAKEMGHEVKLFVPIKAGPNGRIENLSREEFLKQIKDFNPDVAAFSLMTSQANEGFRIAGLLKKKYPNIKTICGGYHPSADPGLVRVARNGMDFAVIGEGEETFGELLDSIKHGKDPKDVNGLSYVKDGKLIITARRERNLNLDSLPRPFRHPELLRQKELGLIYPPPSEQKGLACVSYSRGCPNNCRFCAEPNMYKNKVVHRSPEDVVDEIEDLQKEHGITNVFFTDTNFTVDKPKVLALCEEIKKRKLKISFEVLGSVNTADEEMLKAMAAAGCKKVGWGIESLSDSTLKTVNKPITVSQTKDVLHTAANLGILNTGFFIIGLEGQDENAIKEEIKHLPEYDIHRLRVTIATPLPGSKWHQEIKDAGIPLVQNLDRFNTENWVFSQHKFTQRKLRNLQNLTFRTFYQDPQYKARIESMVVKFPEHKATFKEYFKTLPFKMFNV